MQASDENTLLRQFASFTRRNPDQLNGLLESDSELIRLSDELILAITTDSIVEEIETGLYDDPFLIGWMIVVANLSDIAASGARPLGLVLFENMPASCSDEFRKELHEGVNAACRAAGTFILGGDTNISTSMQVGATAVGVIHGGRHIQRIGCGVGDALYVSGAMGLGNAFAFARLLGPTTREVPDFRPMPRLREGELIRQHGSACIDTSDGFLPAVANLVELNETGFVLDDPLDNLVDNPLRRIAEQEGIPPWYFLAGPHGEFELLFTIPESQLPGFTNACEDLGWRPMPIGRVADRPGLFIDRRPEPCSIDLFEIVNLFGRCDGRPDAYFQELQRIQLC